MIIDKEHPLFESLKKYNWSELVEFGQVTLQIREGKLRLITVQTQIKVD